MSERIERFISHKFQEIEGITTTCFLCELPRSALVHRPALRRYPMPLVTAIILLSITSLLSILAIGNSRGETIIRKTQIDPAVCFLLQQTPAGAKYEKPIDCPNPGATVKPSTSPSGVVPSPSTHTTDSVALRGRQTPATSRSPTSKPAPSTVPPRTPPTPPPVKVPTIQPSPPLLPVGTVLCKTTGICLGG